MFGMDPVLVAAEEDAFLWALRVAAYEVNVQDHNARQPKK